MFAEEAQLFSLGACLLVRILAQQGGNLQYIEDIGCISAISFAGQI